MGNITKGIKKCCEKLFKIKNKDDSDLESSLSDRLNNTNERSTRKTFPNPQENCTNYSLLNKSLGYSMDKISVYDFKLIKTLGKGSFGKVLLVRNVHNKKYYAMKVLKKEFLKKQSQEVHTQMEREILEKISHPFIVKLHYAFQSFDKLFLVCDYMQGGEIFYHLRKEGCFSEARAKFYICEIILAIEHLHKNGVIYRDLKPENILLDKEGHIKLTDFGLSKIIKSITNDERAFTICGTPEYLAPEILIGKGYNKSVDWWSLGAVMYEMLVGYSPFKENKYKLELGTYMKPIIHHKNISNIAFGLIKELLQTDPSRRLGNDKDTEEIKGHKFFKGVNWQTYLDRRVKPKFVPFIKSEEDLSNFDRMFTDEEPNSINQDKFSLFPSLGREKEMNYDNFTFIPNEGILNSNK